MRLTGKMIWTHQSSIDARSSWSVHNKSNEFFKPASFMMFVILSRESLLHPPCCAMMTA